MSSLPMGLRSHGNGDQESLKRPAGLQLSSAVKKSVTATSPVGDSKLNVLVSVDSPTEDEDEEVENPFYLPKVRAMHSSNAQQQADWTYSFAYFIECISSFCIQVEELILCRAPTDSRQYLGRDANADNSGRVSGILRYLYSY